jgi:hypothetical protein
MTTSSTRLDESGEYGRTEIGGVHSREPAATTSDGAAYGFNQVRLSH